MDTKTWLRNNIKPYLTIIKTWVTDQITAAKTELRNEMTSTSVTGAFKGGFATVAEMPTGSGTKTGDWAALTADDGVNESGIYVKTATAWSYVMDITTFDEAQALLATDAEFSAGASTQKAVTVAQLTTAFSGTISSTEAQADWDSA